MSLLPHFRPALAWACAAFLLPAVAPAEEFDAVKPGSPEWNELFDPPFPKPAEVAVGSPLRQSLFDALRAKVEPAARQKVRFQGKLEAYKNWALFVGRVVDAKGRSISFDEMENDDAVALWLRARSGWKLIDWSVGDSDAFYIIWPEQYGMPRELLFPGE